jgi:hypothetical protein
MSMSTEIAERSPAEVAEIANPFSIDCTGTRIETVIDNLVDRVVGEAETEIKRVMERRRIAAAVRGILAVKHDLGNLGTLADISGATKLFVNGRRDDLIRQFKIINPGASPEQISEVVDGLLRPYYPEEPEPDPSPRRRRGKSE